METVGRYYFSVLELAHHCLLTGIASDGKSAIIPITVLRCAQLLSWGAFQVFLFYHWLSAI